MHSSNKYLSTYEWRYFLNDMLCIMAYLILQKTSVPLRWHRSLVRRNWFQWRNRFRRKVCISAKVSPLLKWRDEGMDDIRSEASSFQHLLKRRSYFESDRHKSHNWQVGIRLNRITCSRVAVRSLNNPSWSFAVQTNHTQKRYPPNRSTSLKLTNEKIACQDISHWRLLLNPISSLPQRC